jgi:hypothetical protein
MLTGAARVAEEYEMQVVTMTAVEAKVSTMALRYSLMVVPFQCMKH